jgi:hypothetical protein
MNSLPTTLIDFRSQLEQGVARDLARRRHLHSLIVRSSAVLAVAVSTGLVMGIAGLFGTNAPSIVERASAALAVNEGTILHVTVAGRQENGDGTTSVWSDESWQATSKPYERRQLEHVSDGPVTETGSVGDTDAVYDAKTNTVYVRKETAAASIPGKALRWKTTDGKVHRVVVTGGRPARPKAEADPIEEPFRREVIELLRSGDAHELGHLTLAGLDAIRIVGNGGNATYFVDAKTYDPIEFRTTGTGGSTSLRFVVYETLPLTASTRALLSVRAQHPGARLSEDPAAFQAAQSRLFPHG